MKSILFLIGLVSASHNDYDLSSFDQVRPEQPMTGSPSNDYHDDDYSISKYFDFLIGTREAYRDETTESTPKRHKPDPQSPEVKSASSESESSDDNSSSSSSFGDRSVKPSVSLMSKVKEVTGNKSPVNHLRNVFNQSWESSSSDEEIEAAHVSADDPYRSPQTINTSYELDMSEMYNQAEDSDSEESESSRYYFSSFGEPPSLDAGTSLFSTAKPISPNVFGLYHSDDLYFPPLV